MRLGPLNISLAKAPTPAQSRRSLDVNELGATGTAIFGGIVRSQDYNPDLAVPGVYDIYDKMRLSDGQVKSALTVIKLPLLGAEWSIDPASDSSQDQKIADFIQTDLFGMTITWQAFLRQALLMLDYGAHPFEKVWEIRDSMVHLRKLAPRHPKSIISWMVDEAGGLASIKQGAIKTGSYEIMEIPVDKLLVFINEQEGSNYAGTSILRAAYKHWYYKDGLYRVDAIAREKRGIGVDVGTLKGERVDETRRKDAEAALMTLHAHEKMFVTEVENEFAYRVEGIGAGGVLDALPSIEHHDLRILRSILAEFLAMGGSSTGSLAMHKDKSAFFLLALRGIAANITDTINRYLIRPWVDYNWSVDAYPQLRHSRLETRDVLQLADAISKLFVAGSFTPNRDTENELRGVMELPPLPEQPQNQATLSRKPKAYEHHVDFAAMSDGLDAAQAKVVKAVNAVQKRQIAKLVELAGKVFDKGDTEAVERIDVPYRQNVADEVLATLKELYALGRREAGKEFSRQGLRLEVTDEPLDVGSLPDVLTFLGLRARSLANLMADRLKSSFVWTVLSQIRDGAFDEPALKSTLGGLSDRETTKVAGSVVTEALNLGRQSVADEHKREIRMAVYSALMDDATCGPCSDADGTEFEMDSAEMEEYRPPYRECEGGGRCRCVLVFLLESEVLARV